MCGNVCVWGGGAYKWEAGGSTPYLCYQTTSSDPHTHPPQVIKMVVKCGEAPGEALQLAVIRALLTFSTAEHFLAHGDCLMAAVRTVFNLALGSEAEIIKRTACNALLQVWMWGLCGRLGKSEPATHCCGCGWNRYHCV